MPLRLNALSGIGGVRTYWCCSPDEGAIRLNALSGIGGVRTPRSGTEIAGIGMGLNALSGIGGVRTRTPALGDGKDRHLVLMPCRALEAFGRGLPRSVTERIVTSS